MDTVRTRAGRRLALEALADQVLEAVGLEALTRLLTYDLKAAVGVESATLLLWDLKLESFQGVSLAPDGRLLTFQPDAGTPGGAPARWLVSDGQLIETPGHGGEGTLVPLLARSGLAGMLALGRPRRRGVPLTRPEARLVSVIAARAALAIENLSYQKELISSERLAALGTMAGMLAHDFRGPITVIRGYAETLAEGALSPEEVAARAALIMESADRLERMTTETLDFARGAERLVRRSVPLAVFLLDLAASLEEELPGLEVVREVRIPDGLRAALDVDKLRRAVSNIAANARDAMGGHGRLRFLAGVEALDGPEGRRDHLVLVLADEGPGVASEVRDRVFQAFVTWGKRKGTGLGLAVARRFVEDHGGTVELLSDPEPPGHGARFRLALPLEGPGPAEGPR